mmetsp:Transcript_32007/g.83354  ORF Transcript_32007/g.83354 Transcript_32007/m.83354 type:complete len:124 (+) Transcript_32007:307-678(+)
MICVLKRSPQNPTLPTPFCSEFNTSFYRVNSARRQTKVSNQVTTTFEAAEQNNFQGTTWPHGTSFLLHPSHKGHGRKQPLHLLCFSQLNLFLFLEIHRQGSTYQSAGSHHALLPLLLLSLLLP